MEVFSTTAEVVSAEAVVIQEDIRDEIHDGVHNDLHADAVVLSSDGASSDCAIVAPPNHYLSQLPTGRAFFDKPLSALTWPPPRRALEADSAFEEKDAEIEIEARSYS